ncbi:ComF family protein [Paenibacillus sp. alder61]|nr:MULTISPECIES: ComF family protein [Paenibacillus]MCA1294000.1 ComF family protein [Paenibacillus sp. alder61]
MKDTSCACKEMQRLTRLRNHRVWPVKECGKNAGVLSEQLNNWGRGEGRPGLVNEASSVSYAGINWSMAKEAVLSPLHNLLAPPGLPCLTCGKMISGSEKGYPEICSSCYASIPWIRNLKCAACGRPVGCPDCTREGVPARNFVLNRSAVAYNATMREWLAQYKFRGNEALGPVLARMAGFAAQRMLRELSEKNGGTSRFRFDAVTFVPVSEDRLMERGFNQARTLALEASAILGSPLLPLLERIRHTEKQSFKSRWQRLRDLQGIFCPADNAWDLLQPALYRSVAKTFPRSVFSWHDAMIAETSEARPVRLLLVDDVYTTGSTVDTCAGLLRELCEYWGRTAEVYCLTWARS